MASFGSSFYYSRGHLDTESSMLESHGVSWIGSFVSTGGLHPDLSSLIHIKTPLHEHQLARPDQKHDSRTRNVAMARVG